MNTKEKDKNSVVLIFLAVLCALLFSTSGIMVTWLKDSFTPYSQLVVRASVALLFSFGYLLFTDTKTSFKNKTDFRQITKKYNKKLITPLYFLRAGFNFCFIMTINAQNATMALLILLFVKMVTNVAISAWVSKKKPSPLESVGYFLVSVGIFVYGYGQEGLFDLVLLWAVGSGVLEAIRVEIINRLSINDQLDKNKLAVVEFAAMLCVAGFFTILTGSFLKNGVEVVSSYSLWGMALAVLAFWINYLDYYLVNKLPPEIYSAILATEIGFAGWLNYKFLIGYAFDWQQKAALLISIVSMAIVGYAATQRKKKEEVLEG